MTGLPGFSSVDGNVLEGVSATTLWTLRNRATEAKRSDGVRRHRRPGGTLLEFG
jgi:hypothetical protein